MYQNLLIQVFLRNIVIEENNFVTERKGKKCMIDTHMKR